MKSSSRKPEAGQEETCGLGSGGRYEAETPDAKDAVERRRSVLKQTEKSLSFNDRHLAKKYADSAGASPPPSPKKSRRREASSKSDAELAPSATRDAKPRRPGALPKYDFTFRCVERAEKRKEFFSKLEEKIHAKEVEKSTMEARAKEKEEAEIKMLRKSLIFKANPMPSFYQEPPPPKPQLKKIPTTKPKSPKLSRRRTPATSDSDDQSSCSSAHIGRLSLDSKMVKNKGSRGTSPVQEKHPVRKSLPKLSSEKRSSPLQENSHDNTQAKSTSATEPNLSHPSDEARKDKDQPASVSAVEEHEKTDSAPAAELTTIEDQSK